MAFVVLFHQATVHRRFFARTWNLVFPLLPATHRGKPYHKIRRSFVRGQLTTTSMSQNTKKYQTFSPTFFFSNHQKSPKTPPKIPQITIVCFFVLREIGRQGFVGTKQTVSRIGTFNRGLSIAFFELSLLPCPASHEATMGTRGDHSSSSPEKKAPIFLGLADADRKICIIFRLSLVKVYFSSTSIRWCVCFFYLIDMFYKNPRFWGLDMWQPLGFLPVPHCPPWPLLAISMAANQIVPGCAGTHATRHIFSGSKNWIHPWDDWIFRKSIRNGW